MAGLSGITNVWNNIKEIDLRPLRNEALQMVKIAIVGEPGSGRAALAAQMRRDPARPSVETQSPVLILDHDSAQQAADADLIILMINSRSTDFEYQKGLARGWSNADKKVLVFVNQQVRPGETTTKGPWANWGEERAFYGSVDDIAFLQEEFVPTVLNLLSDQLLSLGRYFPLFRVPIAYRLINDTSLSNATYALSTGLAEIVPVFDIPLNVADIIVLTKAQGFLVYKLGLSLGLSTEWQDYVAEFGSVLGGGFLWRQLARSLVGLIPGWGIVPKVAVAYAGTYVVGMVVLQWYLTGRHVTRKQMREFYRQAFNRGKNIAGSLVNKVPRPRLRKSKPNARLASRNQQTCPNCGLLNAPDARFCQYCGQEINPGGQKAS